MRELMAGLGIGRHLTFLELDPDGYEHCVIGGERFDIPRGLDRYIARLEARFPHEKEGIRAYFRLAQQVTHELTVEARRTGRGAWVSAPWRTRHLLVHGLRSIGAVVSGLISDPMLKAILTIQAGDHGLGPSDAPAAVHFAVQGHYFEGGWYPRGGGRALPRAFLRELKAHGGAIRLQAAVSQILTERAGSGWRAVGVRLQDGTEIRAKRVISNADPGVTYGRLLPSDRVSPRIRRKLDRQPWSVSALSLFMAVDADLEAMGCNSGNFWYSQTPDIQAGYDVANLAAFDAPEFPGQFLTVTTLKDRLKGDGRIHTCESFVFVSWALFERWAATRYGARPDAYAAMKEDLSLKMLRGLDRIVPGISSRVVFRELGTPLTNWHYCMSTRGNLYGTAKTRGQVGPWAWPIRSEIDGLNLCGASTISHGVMGAMMSGLFSAASSKGCRAAEMLGETGDPTFLPADDTSVWPADQQARLARHHAEVAAK
jgi:phytoene dehydrogenase-like protein